MLQFLDKRVLVAMLLKVSCLGLFVGAGGYVASGLMGDYPTTILPYYYFFQSIFFLAVIILGFWLVNKNPKKYALGFSIISIILLLACYISVLLGLPGSVFLLCLFLPTAAFQMTILVGNAISLAFDIREYRRFSSVINLVFGVGGLFFCLLFPGLIFLFNRNILILAYLVLFIFGSILYGQLEPLPVKLKRVEKPTEVTIPPFFPSLLIYSVMTTIILVLLDYIFMSMLKKTFNKEMIGVVSTLFWGVIFSVLISTQLKVQPWILKRFGVAAPFTSFSLSTLGFAVITFIFPNFTLVTLMYVVCNLICLGSYSVAISIIMNTISTGVQFRFRGILAIVPLLIGKAIIASSVLYLLGERYATTRYVLVFIVLFTLPSLFLVRGIREGYNRNLKNQVEKTRYAFFGMLYTPEITPVQDTVIITEIGRKCPIYVASQFFKNVDFDPVPNIIQDLDKTKDMVNIQARIKLLGQLDSNKIEGAFIALANINSKIVQDEVAETIAIRALTFKLTEPFRNFISKQLELLSKEIISLSQVLQVTFPEYMQLELESRRQFSMQRFLFLFASLNHTRSILNSIPNIQDKIFVKSNQIERANAIEYLMTISENSSLKIVLQQTLEPSKKTLSQKDCEIVIAADPWLCRISSIQKFIPGVNMNIEEKVLFLRKVSLFQSLSAEALEVIAESLVESTAKANDVIFSRGDEANCMYMLVSGALEIQGQQAFLNEVKPFGIFGEIALLDNQPRSGTAKAKTDAVLLSLYKQEFIQLMEDIPVLSQSIIQQILGYLRDFLPKDLPTE